LTTYLNQPEIDPPMGDSEGRIICQQATIGWPTEEKDDPELTAAFTLKGLDFEPPKGQMTIVCGPLGSGKTLLVSSLGG
jgi:ABC-type multidrug transport system fused ATPase/permease subunit